MSKNTNSNHGVANGNANVNNNGASEESYSMYPQTTSPPQLTQPTAQFGYQAAPQVPFYGNPHMYYNVYSPQTPQYHPHLNMMNRGSMIYPNNSGNGMNPQGSQAGEPRKKWSNNSPNFHSMNSTTNNGSYNKTHHYQHNNYNNVNNNNNGMNASVKGNVNNNNGNNINTNTNTNTNTIINNSNTNVNNNNNNMNFNDSNANIGNMKLPNNNTNNNNTNNNHMYQTNKSSNHIMSNNINSSISTQYKFDTSKLKTSDLNFSMTFPLFFNTNEDEFSKARARRHELRLKSNEESKVRSNKSAVSDSSLPAASAPKNQKVENRSVDDTKKINKSPETSIPAIEFKKMRKRRKKDISSTHEAKPETKSKKKLEDKQPESKPDTKPEEYSEAKKIIVKQDPKQAVHINVEIPTSKSNERNSTPSPSETPSSSSSNSSSMTPTSSSTVSTETTPSSSTIQSSTTVKPTAKSWSAIASSGIPKSKNVASSNSGVANNANATTSSNMHSQNANKVSQQSTANSQKKDKKYIPSTTKNGTEPLGTIALRMSFDSNYIPYTLKTLPASSSIPIKSIVPRGIINNANICFMSSVLQVLLYCKPFIDILNVISLRNTNSKSNASSFKLIDACVEFYKQFDEETVAKEKLDAINKTTLQDAGSNNKQKAHSASVNNNNGNPSPLNPEQFYSALSTIYKFKDLGWGHQEDAEEFLTHMLDQLHEEFIAGIYFLTDNEIQNLLQSVNDPDLKIYFIRCLSQYKKAEFMKNISSSLKELISKYGSINDTNEDGSNGWHEVSSSSKKGKKTRSAAKRTFEIESSPISCLFGGQFRSVLDVPSNKESQSITLDPFQTIQLDISDPAVNDLDSAFKKFSEFEFIPFKSSSGADVEAKKQTFIDKLPTVLLIHLKRFSFINNTDKDNSMANYNAYHGRIEKIRKKISYNHELVIPAETITNGKQLAPENRTYELTGVVYHHGLSSDGGHYTADIYHKEVDKWYRIDDVTVTELEKDDVLKGGENSTDSRTAYILMYQKL
ncbi:hypothetical protein TBLA_0B01930 [Henningerozyma blattae CBS 6284]|uniref:ubiquitinyl hydrolase 1 n=1 Tax=Henningerozyma blattae (strain ATCC 34711 / CBS 6284 / DSM 70876 / NBRC 10599 / NRRL Y-10934 / UCD 77-7) TaxID=1071380 RepID=I2GY34_HENB6|nr:hypothetical protein TBLA_0B01930 [Tetrapisispora blattae CBS 6284]CCH59036.1 hypothetical protein TBLA_0B01930 [Tetrapisispora blattae CBS 6284]